MKTRSSRITAAPSHDRVVNPFQKKVGWRSGKPINQGKIIRKHPDGFDNFDDYWPESEAESTFEVSTIKERNDETSEASSNFKTDLKPPSKPIQKNGRFTGHKSLAPPGNNVLVNPFKKKFGGFSGRPITKKKEIKLDAHGFENISAYFSATESESSFNLTVNDKSTNVSLPFRPVPEEKKPVREESQNDSSQGSSFSVEDNDDKENLGELQTGKENRSLLDQSKSNNNEDEAVKSNESTLSKSRKNNRRKKVTSEIKTNSTLEANLEKESATGNSDDSMEASISLDQTESSLTENEVKTVGRAMLKEKKKRNPRGHASVVEKQTDNLSEEMSEKVLGHETLVQSNETGIDVSFDPSKTNHVGDLQSRITETTMLQKTRKKSLQHEDASTEMETMGSSSEDYCTEESEDLTSMMSVHCQTENLSRNKSMTKIKEVIGDSVYVQTENHFESIQNDKSDQDSKLLKSDYSEQSEQKVIMADIQTSGINSVGTVTEKLLSPDDISLDNNVKETRSVGTVMSKERKLKKNRRKTVTVQIQTESLLAENVTNDTPDKSVGTMSVHCQTGIQSLVHKDKKKVVDAHSFHTQTQTECGSEHNCIEELGNQYAQTSDTIVQTQVNNADDVRLSSSKCTSDNNHQVHTVNSESEIRETSLSTGIQLEECDNHRENTDMLSQAVTQECEDVSASHEKNACDKRHLSSGMTTVVLNTSVQPTVSKSSACTRKSSRRKQTANVTSIQMLSQMAPDMTSSEDSSSGTSIVIKDGDDVRKSYGRLSMKAPVQIPEDKGRSKMPHQMNKISTLNVAGDPEGSITNIEDLSLVVNAAPKKIFHTRKRLTYTHEQSIDGIPKDVVEIVATDKIDPPESSCYPEKSFDRQNEAAPAIASGDKTQIESAVQKDEEQMEDVQNGNIPLPSENNHYNKKKGRKFSKSTKSSKNTSVSVRHDTGIDEIDPVNESENEDSEFITLQCKKSGNEKEAPVEVLNESTSDSQNKPYTKKGRRRKGLKKTQKTDNSSYMNLRQDKSKLSKDIKKYNKKSDSAGSKDALIEVDEPDVQTEVEQNSFLSSTSKHVNKDTMNLTNEVQNEVSQSLDSESGIQKIKRGRKPKKKQNSKNNVLETSEAEQNVFQSQTCGEIFEGNVNKIQGDKNTSDSKIDSPPKSKRFSRTSRKSKTNLSSVKEDTDVSRENETYLDQGVSEPDVLEGKDLENADDSNKNRDSSNSSRIDVTPGSTETESNKKMASTKRKGSTLVKRKTSEIMQNTGITKKSKSIDDSQTASEDAVDAVDDIFIGCNVTDKESVLTHKSEDFSQEEILESESDPNDSVSVNQQKNFERKRTSSSSTKINGKKMRHSDESFLNKSSDIDTPRASKKRDLAVLKKTLLSQSMTFTNEDLRNKAIKNSRKSAPGNIAGPVPFQVVKRNVGRPRRQTIAQERNFTPRNSLSKWKEISRETFRSGISHRYSSRISNKFAPLTDDDKSGAGDDECFLDSVYTDAPSIEMEETSNLTPCLITPGSKKKKGNRRVTISEPFPNPIVSDDTRNNTEMLDSVDAPTFKIPLARSNPLTPFFSRPAKEYSAETPVVVGRIRDLSPDATYAYSMSESPVHVFEMTNSVSPETFIMPERESQKIVQPEAAPPGVRRSQRTRVQTLEWYKNERVLYDRRKSGLSVSAIQPSREKFYIAQEKLKKPRNWKKKKRKKNIQGMNTPRNLSVHEEFPSELDLSIGTGIVVIHKTLETEVLVDCLAYNDMNVYINSEGGEPTAADPYVICVKLDQKSFRTGNLIVRSLSEKPLQQVTEGTLLYEVLRGKVAVTIHKTTRICEAGDEFFIPDGNVYSIKNMRKDEAKLSFKLLKS